MHTKAAIGCTCMMLCLGLHLLIGTCENIEVHCRVAYRLYVADAMRLFTAALACVLCAALDGQQRAALFSAVQSAAGVNGRTQCSPLPPLVALSARSMMQCSLQCVGIPWCCPAFNFKQSSPFNCELFSELTSNFTEVPGCTLYQASDVIKAGDFM